jgi:hypothetical protein
MGTLRFKLLLPLAALAALAAIAVPYATASHSTFVSALYHYSFQVPKGFRARAATIQLTPGFFPSAEPNDPGVDQFTRGNTTIGMAATPLAKHESLAAWVKSRIAVISRHVGCVGEKAHPMTVDGGPAVELLYHYCFGYFDVVEAVHGGRGYDLYWIGPPETGTFRSDLASFHFTP